MPRFLIRLIGILVLSLAWSVPVAQAAAPVNAIVRAIATSGSDVYVGGSFTNIAGIPQADYIAKWDGSSWSALGSNGAGNGALNNAVLDIAVVSGTVYVVGSFTNAGNDANADYLAKWNGTSWSAVASVPPTSPLLSVAVSGADVYVGGSFNNLAGNGTADYIARWTGSAWANLGDDGNTGNLNGAVTDTVHDICIIGSDVYAVGTFFNVGGIPQADGVARWNNGWFALGSNGSGDGALHVDYNWQAFACAVSGANLIVGGAFTNVANIAQADLVARWNGTTWSAIGGYNGNGAIGQQGELVEAVAVSGSDIYVAGSFTGAFGNPKADRIARWNGSAWSALGSNGSGNGALNDWGQALAVASGAVYVGGGFTNAGGDPQADFLAMWAGSSWSDVGGGPVGFVAKPDGWIQKGNGPIGGNNTYNTTGAGQAKSAIGGNGSIFDFYITAQNDGSGPDKFYVDAGCAAGSQGFVIHYFKGNTATDVTTAVNAGTYQTPLLATNATNVVRAHVKVNAGPSGSVWSCSMTVTSVADPIETDVVGYSVKRP